MGAAGWLRFRSRQKNVFGLPAPCSREGQITGGARQNTDIPSPEPWPPLRLASGFLTDRNLPLPPALSGKTCEDEEEEEEGLESRVAGLDCWSVVLWVFPLSAPTSSLWTLLRFRVW